MAIRLRIVGGCYAPIGDFSLDPEPAGVGAARRFVKEKLTSSGLDDDLVDTAVLLASELVTNAVMHTDSRVRVCVGVGPGARIEVHDSLSRTPVRRVHNKDSMTGRGLELVEMLASGYGVDSTPGDGKSVWFTVGAPSGSCRRDWGAPPSRTSTSPAINARLLSLPRELWAAMREHNESLLREYALYSMSLPDADLTASHQISAADNVRNHITARARALEAAGTSGEYMDLMIPLTADEVASLELLGNTMVSAERLAGEGKLLTRVALPEIKALRAWVLEQLIGQFHGANAVPWRHRDMSQAEVEAIATPVDVSWVAAEAGAVMVGDESNRIIAVSPAAAEVLGWTVETLIGRRLVTIIPTRLHEAHVAGFTRHLITGEAHILGQEVLLPAVRKDGSEVEVRVTLERRDSPEGAAFVAWMRL